MQPLYALLPFACFWQAHSALSAIQAWLPCFAGAAHVTRAHRVCLSCNSGAVGNERLLLFERAALVLCDLSMKAFSQAVATHDVIFRSAWSYGFPLRSRLDS